MSLFSIVVLSGIVLGDRKLKTSQRCVEETSEWAIKDIKECADGIILTLKTDLQLVASESFF